MFCSFIALGPINFWRRMIPVPFGSYVSYTFLRGVERETSVSAEAASQKAKGKCQRAKVKRSTAATAFFRLSHYSRMIQRGKAVAAATALQETTTHSRCDKLKAVILWYSLASGFLSKTTANSHKQLTP
jgi:hypothetical protein